MPIITNYTDVRHDSLFAFVGIDGCGKSSLIDGVHEVLLDGGIEATISKAYSIEQKAAFEPSLAAADDTEIMFMFQSFCRRQRRETIEALERGHIVLADRWDEAYEEYHSQNGPLSVDPMLRQQIGRLAFEGLKPHYTFYVQLDPLIAAERLAARSFSHDFFDKKPLETHIRQALYYDGRALDDDTWITLDGRAKPVELVERVVEDITKNMNV